MAREENTGKSKKELEARAWELAEDIRICMFITWDGERQSARPIDAMERLRRRFPHALALRFEPEGALEAAAGSYAARLRDLDDHAVCLRFVRDVRGTEADAAERALLAEALDRSMAGAA